MPDDKELKQPWEPLTPGDQWEYGKALKNLAQTIKEKNAAKRKQARDPSAKGKQKVKKVLAKIFQDMDKE